MQEKTKSVIIVDVKKKKYLVNFQKDTTLKKIHKATNKNFDSNFEEQFAELWSKHSNYPIVHHHIVVLSQAWEIDFAFPDI